MKFNTKKLLVGWIVLILSIVNGYSGELIDIQYDDRLCGKGIMGVEYVYDA